MTEPFPIPSPSDHELEALALAAKQETGAAGVAIALEMNELVVCRARAGERAPALGARADTGISGEALRSGEIQRCLDTESDPQVNAEVSRQLGIRSIIVVPIRRDGRSVGVVSAFWQQPDEFGDDAVRALQEIAATVSEETPASIEPVRAVSESGPKPAPEEPPAESWIRRAVPALTVAVFLVLLAFGLLLYRAETNGYRAAVKAPEQAPAQPAPPAAEPAPATPAPPPSFIDALRMSAEAGDPNAQLSLAKAYRDGEDVQADPVAACAWFIVASANGNQDADAPLRELTSRMAPAQIADTRYELGQMYASGRGVKPDRVTAYRWFLLAKDGGNRRAGLGMDILRRFMTSQEVDTAERRAADWLARHRTRQ